jgi:hypothetical protein
MPYIWLPGMGYTMMRYEMLLVPVAGIILLAQIFFGMFKWRDSTKFLRILFMLNVALFLWILFRINTDLLIPKLERVDGTFVLPFVVFGNMACWLLGGMIIYLTFYKLVAKNKLTVVVSILIISIFINAISLFMNFFPESQFCDYFYVPYSSVAHTDLAKEQGYISFNEFMTKKLKRIKNVFRLPCAVACFCIVVASISIVCFDGRFNLILKNNHIIVRIIATIAFIFAIIGGIIAESKAFPVGIFLMLFFVIFFATSKRMKLGICVITILLFALWPLLCQISLNTNSIRNKVLHNMLYNKLVVSQHYIQKFRKSHAPDILLNNTGTNNIQYNTVKVKTDPDKEPKLYMKPVFFTQGRFNQSGVAAKSFRVIWEENSIFCGRGVRTNASTGDGNVHAIIAVGGVIGLLLMFIPSILLIYIAFRENLSGNPYALIVLTMHLVFLCASPFIDIYMMARLTMLFYFVSLTFLSDSLWKLETITNSDGF